MSTSGLYLAGTPTVQQLIDECYERIGIIPALLDKEKINSAKRSFNLALQAWLNKGLNLFTVRMAMMGLTPYQAVYNLPPYATDILEATIRYSVRNLNGVASSNAGGNASLAFDGNPATSCVQTAPNGTITYTWTNPYYIITLVGVQSFVTDDYTLQFQYNNGTQWVNALTLPTTTFQAGIVTWFNIITPAYGNAFQVTETNGATLNIAELYFNNNTNDTIMTRMSRSEYMSYPNKSAPTSSKPTLFYVDRQINPVVYLWQVPSVQYNNLFITYIEQIQDIGQMVNNPEVPARFLDALCAEAALRVAAKFAPDKMPALKGELIEAAAIAHEEDRERVPLRMLGDMSQGWGYPA